MEVGGEGEGGDSEGGGGDGGGGLGGDGDGGEGEGGGGDGAAGIGGGGEGGGGDGGGGDGAARRRAEAQHPKGSRTPPTSDIVRGRDTMSGVSDRGAHSQRQPASQPASQHVATAPL